jgi:hypothetical protein
VNGVRPFDKLRMNGVWPFDRLRANGVDQAQGERRGAQDLTESPLPDPPPPGAGEVGRDGSVTVGATRS